MLTQKSKNNTLPYLSIIIPAYNEEKRLVPTLNAVKQFLSTQAYEAEVIVVDDGSDDDTALMVSEIPKVILLKLPFNQGKGAAVRAGMCHARGIYRLFMDADNATSIDQWPRLEKFFLEGCAVVVSSRYIAGANIVCKQPPVREWLGSVFRFLVRAVVPCGVHDSQNGFKAFTAEAAYALFSQLQTTGWAFDVEVLYKARQLGLPVKEVPIEWSHCQESKLSFVGMVRMLYDLIRIRLH